MATVTNKDSYAIQSPFTGALHYPGSRSWTNPKKSMKRWLEGWGLTYVEKKLDDGRVNALVIKDAPIPIIPTDRNLDNNPVVSSEEIYCSPSIQLSREGAEKILNQQVWPILYFRHVQKNN